jgi:ZIP family zinc transporter
LTVIAGLSTGVGSLIALFAKRANMKFLSVSLGFSAGVMIYVSMVEIFFKAKMTLTAAVGEKNGLIAVVAAFFGGMLLIAVINKLIPLNGMAKADDSAVTGRGLKRGDSLKVEGISAPLSLMRSGLLTAVTLGIHNFPEGLATFMSALRGAEVAVPIVAAIAIHNIPEGIAVSVPVYYATGKKGKAFGYSFLSGITEPLGALIGYFILFPFLTDTVMAVVFAAVAGIMVFISVDELLPSARKYGANSLSVYGLVCGMLVMAVSLILFA